MNNGSSEIERLSIVIPCYHDAEFLRDALTSVAAQSLAPSEVLIVDDGSDPPIEVPEGTGLHDIGVIRHSENRGLSAARNTGAENTTGEFLCFVDADDELEPSWLERGLAVLRDESSLSFVSHWLRTFGDEEWDWTPESCDLESLLDRNTVNGAAIMRRYAFEAIGGFDESLRKGCEDWEFWIRMVRAGHQGAIVPDFLYRYRRRRDSMSRIFFSAPDHSTTLRTIAEKHEGEYRERIEELVASRLARISEHRRRRIAALRERSLDAEPILHSRRREVKRLAKRIEAVGERREREKASRRVPALEAECSALERRCAELEGEVKALTSQVDDRNDAIRMLQVGVVAQLGAVQRLEQELSAEQLQLRNSEAQCSALAIEVKALRSSMSWLVSAPLRAGWARVVAAKRKLGR